MPVNPPDNKSGDSSKPGKKTRSTRQILKGRNHILHSVFAQTRKLSQIAEIVQSAGGVEVAVSSLKNNHLVLCVPNAAIATRLRYRQQNILASLRRRNFEVKTLQIRVQPEHFSAPPVTIDRELSAKSARYLVETADHIEDDNLRRALTRLARNSTQKD